MSDGDGAWAVTHHVRRLDTPGELGAYVGKIAELVSDPGGEASGSLRGEKLIGVRGALAGGASWLLRG